MSLNFRVKALYFSAIVLILVGLFFTYINFTQPEADLPDMLGILGVMMLFIASAMKKQKQ